MEQIYYTQCPVGYGLGASNGFQIKRLGAGYPTSGDFRHLGLRAFPGGGRTLAPPALRYRRDGGVAEVAWLTPRPNEYETERGLWGRPGGHFAHGLRLDDAEMRSIQHWPAGLYDGPAWKRADREPSRGRPPDDFDLGAAGPSRPPDFADVAPLAVDIEPERLATLLTALATVAREGRTLFLIDEPHRLGPRIALLTFAFPEPLRADLTFSTYHDRPEELPGYRIQGTIPAARPNRAALMSLGVVADLTAGTFEPRVEPAPWARTLAGWLTRHGPIDEADWTATEARSKAARRVDPPESAWSDAWLGPLFAYPEARRSPAAPGDPREWADLRTFAEWLGRSGLAEDWVRARPPGWWLEAAPSGGPIAEARAALIAHADLRETWRVAVDNAGWGEAVAAWVRDAGAADRDEAIAAILRSTPRSSRPSFARALLKGLTAEAGAAVLDRLRADPSSDRGMLLPLEAGAAAAAILAGADPGPLHAVVAEALEIPGATSAVLDAVEATPGDRPESVAAIAPAVAGAFGLEGPGGGREGLAWALRRGGAAPAWLAPALRPILADPGRAGAWGQLPDRTPEALRPELARAVLGLARDPGLPDEAFRWGVERLLLPLAPRPNDPTWAETYLRRTPSDLELIRRLFSPESRKLGVPAWLDQARARGEVSPEQAARVDNCRAYARSLKSGDPWSLLAIDLPGVPPEERGLLLGQMLAHVAGPALEGLPFVLDACRGAWADAFRAGSPGLRSLAAPLARCLATTGSPPDRWLDRLAAIADRLGLAGEGGRGFEPDGLAAEVVAATAAIPEAVRWPLRQHLLRDENAWRLLTADVRRELAEEAPEATPEVLLRWDRQLVQEKPERFFAAFLNACDGPRLAAAVSARAADLKSLPPLPWWAHARQDDDASDDLRDAYARTVPLAPLPEGRLYLVRNWVAGPARDPASSPGLSPFGLARWRCLEAITNFRQAGLDAAARWPVVTAWEADLPLATLPSDDRHRFVAWLVLGLEAAESHQLARLAKWLVAAGLDDPDRLTRWADEIDGLAEVPAQTRILRAGMVGDLRAEIRTLIRESRGAKRPRPPRGGQA